MKKRMVSLLLAAAMAGTLAGCGGGAGADTAAAGSDTAAAGSEAGSTAPSQDAGAAAGQTVVKWAMWD